MTLTQLDLPREAPPDLWPECELSEVGAPIDDGRFLDEDCDYVRGREGDWLVKGLLPKIGLCFIAGPSMAGKSFVSLDLASRIAKGEGVLGCRSQRCGAAYLGAEAANGVRRRVEGLREVGGPWDGYFRFIGDGPNLANEEDVASLGRRLGRIATFFEACDTRLGVVVIDTLSASIPGVDENSAQHMSPILTRLQELAVRFSLCVIVVAHTGKEADKGIRGWSGMFANADVVIGVSPSGDGELRTVTVQKVKDAEAGTRHAFSLQVVDLGHDEDGDPISTCVVEWRDPQEIIAKPSRRRRQRPGEAYILAAFSRLVNSNGLKLVGSPHAPAGAMGVEVKALREASFAAGLGGPEPDEPEQQKRWKENRRKLFANSLGYLVDDRELAQDIDMVWRCAGHNT